MVLDPSAVIAVLLGEPEADRLLAAVDTVLFRRLSATSLMETAMVVQSRLGDPGERELDLLLDRMRVETVTVTAEHVERARSAFRRFGKGRHPAALNYGDCFSYALAVTLQEPLLFKDDDFSQTDVAVVDY